MLQFDKKKAQQQNIDTQQTTQTKQQTPNFVPLPYDVHAAPNQLKSEEDNDSTDKKEIPTHFDPVQAFGLSTQSYLDKDARGNLPAYKHNPTQTKGSKTSSPNTIKSGVESLSAMPFNDVNTPAQLESENDSGDSKEIPTHFDPVQAFGLNTQSSLDKDSRGNLPSYKHPPIQKKENKTGLPDNLKSGVENLSGMPMDDVKVHYNSSKPSQLQAHAYAQGTDIHLGSGQEKHLPHEAWHVAQQKQGRVKSTMQMNGVGINNDKGLEREADVMGLKAATIQEKAKSPIQKVENKSASSTASKPIAVHPHTQEIQLKGTANANGLTGIFNKVASGEIDEKSDFNSLDGSVPIQGFFVHIFKQVLKNPQILRSIGKEVVKKVARGKEAFKQIGKEVAKDVATEIVIDTAIEMVSNISEETKEKVLEKVTESIGASDSESKIALILFQNRALLTELYEFCQLIYPDLKKEFDGTVSQFFTGLITEKLEENGYEISGFQKDLMGVVLNGVMAAGTSYAFSQVATAIQHYFPDYLESAKEWANILYSKKDTILEARNAYKNTKAIASVGKGVSGVPPKIPHQTTNIPKNRPEFSGRRSKGVGKIVKKGLKGFKGAKGVKNLPEKTTSNTGGIKNTTPKKSKVKSPTKFLAGDEAPIIQTNEELMEQFNQDMITGAKVSTIRGLLSGYMSAREEFIASRGKPALERLKTTGVEFVEETMVTAVLDFMVTQGVRFVIVRGGIYLLGGPVGPIIAVADAASMIGGMIYSRYRKQINAGVRWAIHNPSEALRYGLDPIKSGLVKAYEVGKSGLKKGYEATKWTVETGVKGGEMLYDVGKRTVEGGTEAIKKTGETIYDASQWIQDEGWDTTKKAFVKGYVTAAQAVQTGKEGIEAIISDPTVVEKYIVQKAEEAYETTKEQISTLVESGQDVYATVYQYAYDKATSLWKGGIETTKWIASEGTRITKDAFMEGYRLANVGAKKGLDGAKSVYTGTIEGGKYAYNGVKYSLSLAKQGGELAYQKGVEGIGYGVSSIYSALQQAFSLGYYSVEKGFEYAAEGVKMGYNGAVYTKNALYQGFNSSYSLAQGMIYQGMNGILSGYGFMQNIYFNPALLVAYARTLASDGYTYGIDLALRGGEMMYEGGMWAGSKAYEGGKFAINKTTGLVSAGWNKAKNALLSIAEVEFLLTCLMAAGLMEDPYAEKEQPQLKALELQLYALKGLQRELAFNIDMSQYYQMPSIESLFLPTYTPFMETDVTGLMRNISNTRQKASQNALTLYKGYSKRTSLYPLMWQPTFAAIMFTGVYQLLQAQNMNAYAMGLQTIKTAPTNIVKFKD